MKEVYLKPELGISTEDFVEPEILSIQLECDQYIQEKLEDDLDDLDGFGF